MNFEVNRKDPRFYTTEELLKKAMYNIIAVFSLLHYILHSCDFNSIIECAFDNLTTYPSLELSHLMLNTKRTQNYRQFVE